MKFNKILLTAIAALGLTTACAQARPGRHSNRRPKVSFGFNIGMPVMYTVRPVQTVPMVAYAPVVRPAFGISVGSGPFGFGFAF